MFKPESYNSLSPYLIVNGAQRLADLLKTVFNATELRKYNREDGSVMHMEVLIDDSVVMISDATADYPGQKTMLHLYVPDVMATFKLAIDNGAN